MKTKSQAGSAASSLVEVMASTVIVAAFFVSIFEVNGMCLRYINASKENVAALECVQDRVEQLRNLDYPTLTSAPAIATLLTSPPNASFLPLKATETVTIRAFANGAPTTPTVTFTRAPGATVTPSQSPAGTIDFSTITIVQVDVVYSWNTTFGGRARSEQTSTLVSAGTKK